ncbi:MAG TPA: zinc ribbon domain-containing protein [Acidimicrobiales bacterium]|nr:zinc ribbon domain-containing protein [Acidimicrobiales bacterium]
MTAVPSPGTGQEDAGPGPEGRLAPETVAWLGADDDSLFFWEGLRRHELLLERCGACDRVRFPPMPACPYCGTEGGRREPVTGDGRVYSWVRVHRALVPEMADQLPYTIATVTLDGGCRMVGRLDPRSGTGPGPEPFDDMPVAAHYVDHDGWTELRFHPAGEGGADG